MAGNIRNMFNIGRKGFLCVMRPQRVLANPVCDEGWDLHRFLRPLISAPLNQTRILEPTAVYAITRSSRRIISSFGWTPTMRSTSWPPSSTRRVGMLRNLKTTGGRRILIHIHLCHSYTPGHLIGQLLPGLAQPYGMDHTMAPTDRARPAAANARLQLETSHR